MTDWLGLPRPDCSMTGNSCWNGCVYANLPPSISENGLTCSQKAEDATELLAFDLLIVLLFSMAWMSQLGDGQEGSPRLGRIADAFIKRTHASHPRLSKGTVERIHQCLDLG